MEVSIIIPVYNKVKLTLNCISSILNSKNSTSFEIIVSDDCSNDETPSIIKKYEEKFSNIKYRRNEENRGFAYTCNRGAELAEGKFLLFLNNDTIVKDHFIDNFFKAYEKFNNVGAVGAKLLYEDNTIQHSGVVIYPDSKIDHLFRYFPTSYKNANLFLEVQAVTGACLFIEKNLFYDLNMFDEKFINGFEDIDLCFKIKNRNLKIIYNPEVEIYHLESKTRKTDVKKDENAVLLNKKWKNVYIDFWLLDYGYNFKMNEEGVTYIGLQKIFHDKDLPNDIEKLEEIVFNEPLEINAFRKLILCLLDLCDFKKALYYADKLYKFYPVLETLNLIESILNLMAIDKELLKIIKRQKEIKFEKIKINKKKIKKRTRDLFIKNKLKQGIYFAKWLVDFIRDYSSYKIFLEYLEKLKIEDYNFFKVWENDYFKAKEQFRNKKMKVFNG